MKNERITISATVHEIWDYHSYKSGNIEMIKLVNVESEKITIPEISVKRGRNLSTAKEGEKITFKGNIIANESGYRIINPSRPINQ